MGFGSLNLVSNFWYNDFEVFETDMVGNSSVFEIVRIDLSVLIICTHNNHFLGLLAGSRTRVQRTFEFQQYSESVMARVLFIPEISRIRWMNN